MRKLNEFIQVITKSPLLWGVLGAVGFYALVHAGPLDVPLVRRYFTGHPVEYMETVMFSVGLAVLILKALDVLSQRASSATLCWGRCPKRPSRSKTCGACWRGSTACRDGGMNTTSAVCGQRWNTSAIAARPTRWMTN